VYIETSKGSNGEGQGVPASTGTPFYWRWFLLMRWFFVLWLRLRV